MYVCEEFCVPLFCFFSLCSVVHYARDCSCLMLYMNAIGG